RQIAVIDLGRRALPGGLTLRQLVVAEADVERSRGDVDLDDIPFVDQGDGATGGGLGADMANAGAAGRPADAAVGDQRDAVAQAAATYVGGAGEHLRHARPAARTFVADHDDVARLHLAIQHALGGRLF